MRFLPRTRGGVIWRAAVACVLVIGFAAATTAVAGLLQVKQIVDYLKVTRPLVSHSITPPSPGAPQTLLLIGVDHRVGQGSGPGNTDTMILVRIDDSSSTINMLSIPRDVAVQIPGFGFSKINAAYADGGNNGPNLLLQTIKQDVFPQLQVNHILVIDFQDFANLITSIGCVYSDVDHRYYNDNNGLSAANNYSSINIQPGYQRLCGNNGAPDSALAFVRFRHNDSDMVRQSRQQDFLIWAKSQFSSSTLLAKQTQLERQFGRDVQTDGQLHTIDGVDEMFGLLFNADGSTIKSIPFPISGNATSAAVGDYLTFDPTQAQQAFNEFMTPTTTPSKSSPPPVSPVRTRRHHRFTLPASMVDSRVPGRLQATQLGRPGLPVYYPAALPSNFMFCFTSTANCNEPTNAPSAYVNSYPRHYTIHDSGHIYPSWVMTLVEQSGGYADMGTGQYFTVQGTTWQDPPILRGAHTVQVVNGKKLYEYSQGGQLALVAWHTPQAVYWISNTLQNFIPADQMVAMAATLTRAAG